MRTMSEKQINENNDSRRATKFISFICKIEVNISDETWSLEIFLKNWSRYKRRNLKLESYVERIYVLMLNDNKNFPCIPPVIHDYKFITDFRKKKAISSILFLYNSAQLLKTRVLPSSTNPIIDQYL